MYPTNVIIAVGTNLGNFKINFQNALGEIAKFSKITTIGNIYISKPYGFKNQNNFHNTAIEILTNHQPLQLLKKIESIENKLMKNKKIINGPRTIDLDIIFFGNKIIKCSQLEIPHPQAINRDFVLKPIFDIRPFYKDPLTKLSIKELLNSINSYYIIKSLNSSYLGKKFF